ncbi:ATP-binding protein [Streptomyces sp. NPDC000410]|uniref:ATP-binding protein n=1 Tax=Streptomyces sp. NPDC000410 TaxID=3154254 RepID=UPI00332B8F64
MRLADTTQSRSRTAPVPDHSRRAACQAILTLPAHDESVPAARHFTGDLLRRWGLAEDTRDSAELIVDELAANAVQHGHADMTVLLALGPDELHIAVADSGEAVRHIDPRSAMAPDEHGRGTGIVEFLAVWTEVRDGEKGRRVSVGLGITPDH